jgi:O-antigen ligase
MFYAMIGATIFSPYIGVVIAFGYLLRKFSQGALPGLGRQTLARGLFALAVWSTVTSYLDKHWVSLGASAVLWMYWGVVVYIQNDRKVLKQFSKYGNWVLLCGLGSAAVGLAQYLGWIGESHRLIGYLFGLGSFVPDPENRITATFGNANLAGAWFSVLALLAAYYFHQTRQILRKNAYLLLMLVYIGSLLLTESRGAIGGLAAGLFVYYFFTYKHLRIGIIACFAAALVLFLIHPALLPRVSMLPESATDRLMIWRICFRLFLHHPVEGVGLANTYFVDAIETGYYRIAHAHNTILAVFVELGTVGGVLFLWMHWSVVKSLLYLNRANHRTVPVLLGLFSCFFVHGLVDYTIMAPQIGLIYIVLTGFVLRLHQEVSLEQHRLEILRREWLLKKARRMAKASGAV